MATIVGPGEHCFKPHKRRRREGICQVCNIFIVKKIYILTVQHFLVWTTCNYACIPLVFICFCGLGLFHFCLYCILHWECCIRNTRKWHLTVSSFLTLCKWFIPVLCLFMKGTLSIPEFLCLKCTLFIPEFLCLKGALSIPEFLCL